MRRLRRESAAADTQGRYTALDPAERTDVKVNDEKNLTFGFGLQICQADVFGSKEHCGCVGGDELSVDVQRANRALIAVDRQVDTESTKTFARSAAARSEIEGERLSPSK